MARSEEVAAAVALKEAGYPVKAIPRGALVEAVASDAPAAAALDSGDVIVSARGTAVRTPLALREALAANADRATPCASGCAGTARF